MDSERPHWMRYIFFFFIVFVFLFGLTCDSNNDTSSDGSQDDDAASPVDDDDDNDDDNNDDNDDDDNNDDDDDDNDDDEDTGPIRYLYGGIVANQNDPTFPHSGLTISLAISSDGTRWAVGVKARRLMLYCLSPEGDLSSETIAPFAGNPEMVLGTDGLPRIVYVDLTNQDLVYVAPSTKGWMYSVVAEDVDYESPPNIAIDGDGNPHITWVYIAGNGGQGIHYARVDGSFWLVSATGISISGYDLAVTGDGQPIIVARHFADLHISRLIDEVWHLEVLEGYYTIQNSPAAIVDRDDRLHIVCGVRGSGVNDLRYVVSQGDDWLVEDACPGFGYPSIALDGEGHPHVTANYYSRIFYARRDPTAGWISEIAEDTTQVEIRTAIAVAPDGTVGVLHSINDSAEFGVREKGANNWYNTALDVGAAVGEYPILRLDSAECVHILFTDDTHDKIIYKISDSAGLNWTTEYLDIIPLDPFMGLAIDQDDRPHVALSATENKALLYGIKTDTGWQYETVEADLQYGVSHLCLELDQANIPHLAYFDDYTNDLKYAIRGPSGWVITTITTEYESADSIALAIDPDGHAHLLAGLIGGSWWYMFRYASNALGDWFDIQLDPVASCHAGSAAIAIVSDTVHALYADQMVFGLRHAWFTNHEWSYESAAYSGIMVSLAIDESGGLHVTTSSMESGLVYTWRDTDGWSQKAVDSIGGGDFYPYNPSFAIGRNGLGHVSYMLNQALWYARFPLEESD